MTPMKTFSRSPEQEIAAKHQTNNLMRDLEAIRPAINHTVDHFFHMSTQTQIASVFSFKLRPTRNNDGQLFYDAARFFRLLEENIGKRYGDGSLWFFGLVAEGFLGLSTWNMCSQLIFVYPGMVERFLPGMLFGLSILGLLANQLPWFGNDRSTYQPADTIFPQVFQESNCSSGFEPTSGLPNFISGKESERQSTQLVLTNSSALL